LKKVWRRVGEGVQRRAIGGERGALNASAIHAECEFSCLDLQEKPSNKIFIGGLPQDDAGLLCLTNFDGHYTFWIFLDISGSKKFV